MLTNKKVSLLEKKTSVLSSEDLIYVSEAHPYGRYESRYMKYGTVEDSMRKTFKPEIDLLHEINENYVDGLLEDSQLSVIGGKKYILLYFKTTRGLMKVISVDLADIVSTYSAGEGLCCVNRVFSADYDYVAHKVHTHELGDLNNISVLSSSAVNHIISNVLTNYYTSNETSSSSLIFGAIDTLDKKFENYQEKGSYLSSNALDSLSGNWDTAYSRTSAVVGSIGYKNSLSTTDILGYSDTTYSNGFGLSINNNEFGVDTKDIAVKNHNHDSEYYKKNETSCVSELNAKFNEFKELSKKDLSDIVDDNTIKVVSNKLSCVIKVEEPKTYYAGRGLSIDTETNTFSTSADYVTYPNVVLNLSNDGYCTIFRDWSFKT